MERQGARMMGPLASAIERLAEQGFTAHFGVVGSRLRAFDSGKTFAADEVAITDYVRFEGISDPDDMEIVYAIEALSGTRGTLVDAFGVYSNPAVSAFLARVPMRRVLGRGLTVERGIDSRMSTSVCQPRRVPRR